VKRTLEWADGGEPNVLLDDGGDMTLLVHLGLRAEKGDSRLPRRAENEEEEAFFALIKDTLEPSPAGSPSSPPPSRACRRRPPRRPPPVPDGQGGPPPLPRHQRQRQRHQVEVRQPLRLPREPGGRHPPRHGRDDGGKVAMVAGFGDVGKGSAASLRNAGCRVMVSEADPICALQASMEGYEVVTMEDAAPRADIFVTATGNVDVITVDHMRAMKHRAIVCNIGHFDSEIQVAALKNFKWDNVKPQVDEIEFPDGKRIILLSEGRW
jgi:adenosylhomocysteinase